jgi:hypothetical protein
MKYLVGLLFCWLAAGSAYGQYIVLHVQGNLSIQSTGAAPAIGTELSDQEAMAFGSKDAQVSLWVLGKGRHLLHWPEDSAFVPNKPMPIAKLIRPSKTYPHYPLQPVLRNQEDFQQHFDRRYLLLPGTTVNFDPDTFPIALEKVFYVRFQHRALNAEVPTRLPVTQDSVLSLDPAQFLNMNGVEVSQADAWDFSIRYTENRKTHNWICNFQPVYETKQLFVEVDLLSDIGHWEKNPEVLKKLKDPNEYYNFVCEAWGVPDYLTFLRWAKMDKGMR